MSPPLYYTSDSPYLCGIFPFTPFCSLRYASIYRSDFESWLAFAAQRSLPSTYRVVPAPGGDARCRICHQKIILGGIISSARIGSNDAVQKQNHQ